MDALYSWPGGRALANAPVNSTDADSKVRGCTSLLARSAARQPAARSDTLCRPRCPQVPSTTASVLLPVDSVASRAKHDATQLFSKDRGSVLPVGSALELQKVRVSHAPTSAQSRLPNSFSWQHTHCATRASVARSAWYSWLRPLSLLRRGFKSSTAAKQRPCSGAQPRRSALLRR